MSDDSRLRLASRPDAVRHSHPIGPVGLEVDDRGHLPHLGREIVELMGYQRDRVARARLTPMDPAWDDALCDPSDWSESPHMVAPELLTFEPSVTLVGEIGGPCIIAGPATDEPDDGKVRREGSIIGITRRRCRFERHAITITHARRHRAPEPRL